MCPQSHGGGVIPTRLSTGQQLPTSTSTFALASRHFLSLEPYHEEAGG